MYQNESEIDAYELYCKEPLADILLEVADFEGEKLEVVIRDGVSKKNF